MAPRQTCLHGQFAHEEHGLFNRLVDRESRMKSDTVSSRNLKDPTTNLYTPELFKESLVRLLNQNPNVGLTPIVINGDGDIVLGVKIVLMDAAIRLIFEPDGLVDRSSVVAWMQYFLARACLCTGDIIEDLPVQFCDTDNLEQITLDVDLARDPQLLDPSRDCTTVKNGLIECIRGFTAPTKNTALFHLSNDDDNVLSLQLGCDGSYGQNMGLSLQLNKYKVCMIPVITNIFFTYGGAMRLQYCGPQPAAPAPGGAAADPPLTQDNLRNMLACWLI